MTRLAAGVSEAIGYLYDATLEDLAAGRVEAPELHPAPVPGVSTVDVEVGTDPVVRIRRYRHDDAGVEGPRPAVVWAHGGGWMGGELDMPEADAVARRLCAGLDAVVFSVDYRLALDATYPAAMDDVVAAFDAAAADHEVDGDRITLGGASAGGNLAAAAAQVLRDRGGAQPVAVVLAYPATDPIGGPYDSERPHVCPPLLWFDQAMTSMLFRVYLGGADPHPYAVPAAGDLAGLPPTLVTTSALDGLEDQAVRYVGLLTAAGVDVTHHRAEDLLHGYLNMVGTVAAADAMLERHAAWIEERIEP